MIKLLQFLFKLCKMIFKISILTHSFLNMPKSPIHIEGIEANGDLTLSDHGQTNVDRGDTVTWIIRPQSGVQKFNKIVKSGGLEVFSVIPAPFGNSGNWRVKISSTISGGSEEKYDIRYTRDGGGELRFSIQR